MKRSGKTRELAKTNRKRGLSVGLRKENHAAGLTQTKGAGKEGNGALRAEALPGHAARKGKSRAE
jgi:hypothetical protein